MRRVLTILIVLLIVLAGVAGAYRAGLLAPLLGESATGDPADAEADEAPAVQEPPVRDDGRVVSDGRVLPINEASLSFSVGGIVEEIAVAEGDVVEAGDLLLRLDAAQQRTAVSRAEAELQRAQAKLDQLKAGPRTQEIAASNAAMANAEAQLLRIQQGSLPGELATAQAALDGANASLQKILQGASDQELIAAKAEIANAEAELTRAQRAYNNINWRNDVGATQESAQLQTATNNFEAARARYEDLVDGPTAADIASAQAEVRRAQAQLEQLRQTLPADVLAAQAQVDQARANFELLEAGTRAEEIAGAEADVAAAVASLQQALVALADAELHAPFAGAIALLDATVGEQIGAGAIVAQIAVLGDWEIRTEDLTEFDIVGIEPGERTLLTFDAIPDLEIEGVVDRIRPIGADSRGDIVYTVIVHPNAVDPRLRWNMTAVATFNVE